MSWVATGMTVVSGISSYVGGKKAERAARKRQKKLQAKLRNLEANRQAIINPYEGSTNLSGMLTDHSGSLTNPYANLSVATKAAEMQIEQSDIALANTLDTMRASGSGAGGATALAQMAMKSKQQVVASIESQEVANEKQRASGEAQLQNQRIAEKKRLESARMSEAKRMQQLDASGKQFMWQQREQREGVQLDRVSAQITGAQQQAAAARADSTAALTGTVSSLAGIAASGAFSGDGNTNSNSNSGSGNTGTNTGAGNTSNYQSQYNSLSSTQQQQVDDLNAQVSAGLSLFASDRKLKKNIKLIGKSPKGINIYAFEYINKLFGKGIFQGVMSDEIPKEAVIKYNDGYDRVDYSKLDVEFKQI